MQPFTCVDLTKLELEPAPLSHYFTTHNSILKPHSYPTNLNVTMNIYLGSIDKRRRDRGCLVLFSSYSPCYSHIQCFPLCHHHYLIMKIVQLDIRQHSFSSRKNGRYSHNFTRIIHYRYYTIFGKGKVPFCSQLHTIQFNKYDK